MYWLFTDETNVTEHEGEFFIYGGLTMTSDQMVALHSDVAAIRAKHGYLDGDRFKFQTASRPSQVTQEQFVSAKAEALSALHQRGAHVIMYVVLHDIAKSHSVQETTEWALNSLIAHFDLKFLVQQNDVGVVCIDRLDPKFGYKYMSAMFAEGITVDGRQRKLDRVLHYSMSCDGASHMSSLTDIALGSMRYAVNFTGGKGKEKVAKELMVPLAQAMWHKTTSDGTRQVGGYGFLQYPKHIIVQKYQAKYDALAATLSQLGSTEDD